MKSKTLERTVWEFAFHEALDRFIQSGKWTKIERIEAHRIADNALDEYNKGMDQNFGKEEKMS